MSLGCSLQCSGTLRSVLHARRLMSHPETLTVLPAFSARQRKEPLEKGSGDLDLAAARK